MTTYSFCNWKHCLYKEAKDGGVASLVCVSGEEGSAGRSTRREEGAELIGL